MVGTRKDIPVSLPLSEGMTLPTALAAPVDEGMMLVAEVRPPRQSSKTSISYTTGAPMEVAHCWRVRRPSSGWRWWSGQWSSVPR